MTHIDKVTSGIAFLIRIFRTYRLRKIIYNFASPTFFLLEEENKMPYFPIVEKHICICRGYHAYLCMLEIRTDGSNNKR